MKFQPGQSGNPAGRPRGSRNRRKIAAERMFDDSAEKLTATVIRLAEQGHPVALRIAMDHVSPAKDGLVAFELPALATAADAVAAMGTVVQGIADGDLTPREAAQLTDVIERYRRTLTTAELEQQLEQIEKKINLLQSPS